MKAVNESQWIGIFCVLQDSRVESYVGCHPNIDYKCHPDVNSNPDFNAAIDSYLVVGTLQPPVPTQNVCQYFENSDFVCWI